MRYGRAGLWLLAVLLLMTGCAGVNPSDEEQWLELTYVTNLEDAEQLITLQEPLLEQKGIRLTRLQLEGDDPTLHSMNGRGSTDCMPTWRWCRANGTGFNEEKWFTIFLITASRVFGIGTVFPFLMMILSAL